MMLRRKQADESVISSRLMSITQPSVMVGYQAATGYPEPGPQHFAVQTIAPSTYDLARLYLPDGREAALFSCSEGEVVSIGRGEQTVVRLDDRHVSRIHAELRWDAMIRAHVLVDCGSSNGTYLDGVRVRRPMRVLDGARIRLGMTELRYRRHRPS